MGPLSLIFNVILSGRKFFIRRLIKPNKLPVRVFSIGNLTLGGTGKTPAVMAVCREASRRGLQPCILTRGYKGTAQGPCFVSTGKGPVLTVDEAGDEPYLMAQELPGTPVVLCKNRYRAGIFSLQHLRYAYESRRPELIFILDDGFQHISLLRDRDVLLLDATRPFWLEKLFPEGRLREPVHEIKRAQIVLITKSDMASDDTLSEYTDRIQALHPEAHVFRAHHKPVSLLRTSGEAEPLDNLRGQVIYAFSGIANPAYFINLLTHAGAFLSGFRRFKDHHRYSQKDIDNLSESAAGARIITTEKDIVKIRQFHDTVDISALKIEFSVEKTFYERLFHK